MSARTATVLATVLGLAAQPVSGQNLKELESLRGLEGLKGLESLQGLKGLEGSYDDEWLGTAQQAQGDSLYRVAREALNAGDYQRAAAGFQRVWERYPRTAAAGDATYWAAFALSKIGGERNLQRALELLQTMPESPARVQHELAMRLALANSYVIRMSFAAAPWTIWNGYGM